jgi:hypothetical protein
MFSELVDDRHKFSPDYGSSMADSLFHPSRDACEFGYDLGSSPPYSSNSDDFADAPDYADAPSYDKMIDFTDDLLMTHYMKYDIDRQPHLFSLVSPNDILPVEPSISLDSMTDPFIRTHYGNEMFPIIPGINDYEDMPEVSDTPSSPEPESLEQMYGVPDQFLSDKIISEITKDGASLDDIIEEDILPFLTQSNSNSNDSTTTMCRKAYHPDYDHCYSKLNEDKEEDIYTSLGSPDDSSGSSSEEVDVVTVTEELQAPFVPKVQVPYRKRRRGQKSQKVKKSQNFSHKTFNAAMKRSMTRITTVRRTYRRKINNSVETTPSSSLPSSAPSSRCSSDVEDAGKRANHNSSERKRREVLRTALQNLRLCVPSVQNNLKAPKVQILNCAKEFIREMKLRDQECAVIKKNLKSKKRLLEMKLKSLAAEFKS